MQLSMESGQFIGQTIKLPFVLYFQTEHELLSQILGGKSVYVTCLKNGGGGVGGGVTSRFSIQL